MIVLVKLEDIGLNQPIDSTDVENLNELIKEKIKEKFNESNNEIVCTEVLNIVQGFFDPNQIKKDALNWNDRILNEYQSSLLHIIDCDNQGKIVVKKDSENISNLFISASQMANQFTPYGRYAIYTNNSFKHTLTSEQLNEIITFPKRYALVSLVCMKREILK